MSEGLIYQKITEVMANIGAVGKDRKNEMQGYKFRGIEDIYNAAHPALIKAGVFCVPQVLEFESSDRIGKTGTVSLRVVMRVCHKFYAADGSFVEVITLGEGMDTSDKASNKAMSAAMKYAFVELLSLPFAEVDDGDKDSPEAGARRRNVPRTEQPIPIAGPVKGTAAQETEIKGGTPEPKAGSRSGKAEEMVTTTAKPSAPAREPGSDDEELIDLPRQRALHRLFADAIKNEAARKHAQDFLRDWLKHEGFVGPDGKGTTKTIPSLLFEEVKARAIAFAENLPA